jgi:glycosyltransferase involved in cell wall biosynthesis
MIDEFTPHVAIYLRTLYNGGIERSFINLMKNLVSKGIRVDLVLDYYEYSPFIEVIPPAVRLVLLDARQPLRRIPKLMDYLRREQPTAIIAANDFSNQVAILAQRLTQVPTQVLITIHTNLSTEMKNASGLKQRIRAWLIPLSVRLLYPLAHRIVPVSKGVGSDLAQFSGIAAERIDPVYNPVITLELLTKATLPVEHPWLQDDQVPVIIGIGRLTAQKDFKMLIQAFARVRKARPARLIILGDGPLRAELMAQVAALGLQADVDLPGFVTNPYAYLAKSAVFALSSAWEGLGLVVIEALAVGVPVVSTSCPSGPAEILDGGRYGELVPVRDSAAMAAGLLRVLAGQEKTVSKAWLKQFTADYSMNRYLELLGIDVKSKETVSGDVSGDVSSDVSSAVSSDARRMARIRKM